MATFRYVAKNMQSQTVKGTLDAENQDELARLLRGNELFLMSSQNVTKDTSNKYKLKLDELSSYSREIGTMLGSGLSLVRTFSIMVERAEKQQLKFIYNDIYIKIQQGITLSDAMAAQGPAFPELIVQMFRAGETSGQMEKTAMIMADQYDKQYKLKNKMKAASVYPIILVVVTILVIIIIFTFVLPSFMDTFKGQSLPGITQFMLGLSNVMTQYWMYVVIGICILVLLINYIINIPTVRVKVDHNKLRFPKVGRLMRTIYTARFARTMCSLYSSGISIVNGLDIVKTTIGNKYIESQFDEAIHDVRNGMSLSQAIGKIDGFDPKLYSSIYVGEESGQLDKMLTTLADDFDYDADQASTRMVALMEPAMIIILAVIIGLVMVSVILPIYQMYSNTSSMG